MGSRTGIELIHADWAQIVAYLEGTLAERELYLVERHFGECRGCRENLFLRIKSLPFQPLTFDGEPRLLAAQTWRCGWSRMLGPYLAAQLAGDQQLRFESHLLKCEWCGCQLAIHLASATCRDRSISSFFYSLWRWLLRRS
ncbi:MAG TPA: zf-HC2 domain-containing protein [Blastocatellia bacterium]|nr:zf-HC2 domain-containing protein [Blastocatellia bacterium]